VRNLGRMSNAFPGVEDSLLAAVPAQAPTPLQAPPSSQPRTCSEGALASSVAPTTMNAASSVAWRARKRLVAVLSVLVGVGLVNSPANAHLRSTSLRAATLKAAPRAVKVKPKPATGIKSTQKTAGKPTKLGTQGKRPKVILAPTSTATAPLSPQPTETTTTTPQARVLPAPPVLAGVVTTVTQVPAAAVTPAVISPLPLPGATVAPVGAGTAITAPPAVTTTTLTTLPPAPFPAPADPPKRASAATLDPYRGLGTWVDKLDWSNLYGKNKPVVTLATIDQIAAAGIQTIYLQIPSYQITSPDIYEPERLLPLIDRAHALGMYVVGWYFPAFLDVNTDLRKVVAMANLDIDGIQIDIEKSDFATLKDINVRNARLSEFNRSIRSLLPGRVITADVIAPTWMDGQVGRWAWPNYPPAPRGANWPGFPYAELAATYDLTALQVYWTENTANSGWRDAQAFTLENMNRMRAYAGRPDYPIQAIGGVYTSKSPLNDLLGYVEAARAAGSVGVSLYDWTTTPPSWWPALWGFRSVIDARFPAPALPPYAPLAQPATPPVTTTTTTKAPTVVPAGIAVTSTTIPTIQIVGP
jgi:hypothetical protein